MLNYTVILLFSRNARLLLMCNSFLLLPLTNTIHCAIKTNGHRIKEKKNIVANTESSIKPKQWISLVEPPGERKTVHNYFAT